MARRPRRHAARRHNGVGAYHMFFSSALKKAMKGQKSPAARKAAFKKALAAAKAAKAKGFSAAQVAAAKAANVKVQAAKKSRSAKRAGKITVRTARRYAGGKDAYKKLTAAQRRALRAEGRRRKGRVSASKRAAAAVAKQAARPVRRRRVAAKPAARRAVKGGGKGVSLMKQAAAAYRAGKFKSMKDALKALAGKKAAAPASKKPRRAAKKAAAPKKAAARRPAAKKAPAMKSNPRRMRKARRAMRRNPDFRGALSGAKSFASGLASLKLIGEAAVAGIAHGFVAPMVHDKLEQYLPYSIELPVVGKLSAASFSYTITGVAAGSALSALGAAFGQPMLRDVAKVAAVSGFVMDVVGLVQQARGGSYGAIYDQGVTYGAISADGMTYGEIYNDGQTYGGVVANGVVEYGDIVIGEYADAMPADAEDSGADFSVAEGEAILSGPASWMQRFGFSPKRAMGIRSAKSRHAGREGHRWGWLISLVGMDKAAEIAALPPEKRLRVIADLRRQAIASLANAMAERASATTGANLLPVSEQQGLDLTGAPTGAGGALSYGAVYAGNGF